MMRIVAVALLWTGVVIAMPSAPDVARRYGEAVVIVERGCQPTPGCVPERSQGFFVASTGLLATVIPGAARDERVEVIGAPGAEASTLHGRVVAIDDAGLALVQVEPAPTTPVTALAVGVDDGGRRWLVGLVRDDRGVQAVVGGEETRTQLLVPVPRGSPILDEKLQVVAIARRSRGGGSIDALPVTRLRDLAIQARDAPPRSP